MTNINKDSSEYNKKVISRLVQKGSLTEKEGKVWTILGDFTSRIRGIMDIRIVAGEQKGAFLNISHKSKSQRAIIGANIGGKINGDQLLGIGFQNGNKNYGDQKLGIGVQSAGIVRGSQEMAAIGIQTGDSIYSYGAYPPVYNQASITGKNGFHKMISRQGKKNMDNIHEVLQDD